MAIIRRWGCGNEARAYQKHLDLFDKVEPTRAAVAELIKNTPALVKWTLVPAKKKDATIQVARPHVILVLQ